MAQAPPPGAGDRAESADAAKQILTITVREETRTLAVNNIPLSERLIVRKATAMPLEAFVGEIEDIGANKVGLDTIVVLWWLARRANGEPMLTYKKVCDEWPTDLTPDDIDVKVDDPDPEATDPEA